MSTRTKSFWDEYRENIQPKLKNIDIFLKTETPPFSPYSVADILHISYKELKKIMNECGINSINGYNFYEIMKRGSSRICRMFRRTLTCESYGKYYPSEVSYIYEIDPKVTKNAFKRLGLDFVDNHTIFMLLDTIDAEHYMSK